MALDGITLGLVKNELSNTLLGAKVDKIHQPSKNELVFILRTRNGSFRLYMSANNQSPRIHLSSYTIENPNTPPMFCMLLRKRLASAVLSEIKQYGNDRVLELVFDAVTEIGDKTKYYIICEIISQKSNIIFLDSDKKIIDSIKRITNDYKDIREIYPGLIYNYPERQNKYDILTESEETILNAILSFTDLTVSKACLSAIEGISPLISRELAYRTVYGDCNISELSDIEKERLKIEIKRLKDEIDKPKAYSLSFEDNKNFDFTFTKIRQYNDAVTIDEYDSFCDLLDNFYFEKDRYLRTKQKAADLFKLLNNAIERTSKKVNIRKLELEKSKDRDKLKLYAELITANQYKINEKSSYYEIENYYDEGKIIKIKVDPSLTAQQNAQKLYKEYKKSVAAEKILYDLIKEGEDELTYLDSVIDSLSRSSSESEITEIRNELISEGYLKAKNTKNKAKKSPSVKTLEFLSSDGFNIFVGRNNIQNDFLTFKQAKNYDIWLHVQRQPGSHTIISSDNKKVTDNTIKEAAIIAAYYSKASQSSSVAVDYSLVKNIKKPNGAKPGKVIYHDYNTLYVTPDKETVEKLKK